MNIKPPKLMIFCSHHFIQKEVRLNPTHLLRVWGKLYSVKVTIASLISPDSVLVHLYSFPSSLQRMIISQNREIYRSVRISSAPSLHHIKHFKGGTHKFPFPFQVHNISQHTVEFIQSTPASSVLEQPFAFALPKSLQAKFLGTDLFPGLARST